jgi:hypothetical protein
MLLLVFALVVGCALYLLVRGARHFWRARDWRAREALSSGLLAVFMLQQVVQRADDWHCFMSASIIVPLLLAELAADLPRAERAAGAGLVLTLVATIAIAPRSMCDVLAPVGLTHATESRLVRSHGRTFPMDDPGHADDLAAALRVLDATARPGEALFVGPRDLRRTNYGDTFVYFLEPELRPASYFTEMNPDVANHDGSSLRRDLEVADHVLLTTRFDGWDEPNDSSILRSTAPNAVIAARFCPSLLTKTFELYRRCR